MFEPEAFRKDVYCIEKSTCEIVGTLRSHRQTFEAPAVIRHPHNDPAPGELCPPMTPSHYAPGHSISAIQVLS